MAVDMFIKLEGVEGEAKDDKHKGWIDVLSWSWGMSQSGTMHMGGGGGAGKVNVTDLSFTKFIDKSTADIMIHNASGKHYPKANMVVRKAGDKPLEYLKIEMKNVLISSISTGGSGGEDRLTENVTLNFETVKVEYTPQKKDGSGEAVQTFGWDVGKNTAL